MGKRISIQQLTIAAIVAAVFVAVSIFLRGYLAAISFPHWYIDFVRAHKHTGLQVWWFFEAGIPEAALAALCGAALGRLTRNPHLLLAVVALVVWNVVPIGLDIWSDVSSGCSFSSELQAISLWWPVTVATQLLVCLALVMAFRHAAKDPPATEVTP
jgi:hypothetical protein